MLGQAKGGDHHVVTDRQIKSRPPPRKLAAGVM